MKTNRAELISTMKIGAAEMEKMAREIEILTAEVQRLGKLADDWRGIALHPDNQPLAIQNRALEGAAKAFEHDYGSKSVGMTGRQVARYLRGLKDESEDWLNMDDCGNCHKCLEGKAICYGPYEIAEALTRMIVCPMCGNKRCPKATDHHLDCTGSNEPGQPGSVY